MKFTPHDYQRNAAAAGTRALAQPGGKLMIVSPTGSGKSIILALLLEQNPDLVLTVPTMEIGASVYDKLHPGAPEPTREDLAASRIVTIKEYYNRLMEGSVVGAAKLAHDEGHHTTDNTHELVHALCGHCPRVCVTATPYRGTPDETLKLRSTWGEPYVALTLAEAVARGVIRRPDFVVWPLLNDETLKVSNGEFETKSVEGAIEDVIPDLLGRVRSALFGSDGHWLRPTMFTLPGVVSARSLTAALSAAGLPAVCVVGATDDRQAAFREVVARRQALVQVNVVSEGVDLPMRVSVDLAPTMSPVRFMQGRVGRITRPSAETEAPAYVCTNHNITRHSYLWAGIVPKAQIKAAQQAWGPDWKPSRRHMARALGLEGFGRFQVTGVPTKDGTRVSLYSLQSKDGMHQYAVLLHPCLADPMYFERTNAPTGKTAEKRLDDGRVVQYAVKDYGPWKRIPCVPTAEGYVSVRPQPITPKMHDWWKRSAEGRGLDPNFVPDARQFVALPLMINAKLRFEE